MSVRLLLTVLCLAAPTSLAQALPLTVLVDTSTEMPLASIQGGRLEGGLHRDLGVALAERLGRDAQFLLLPRKRIDLALQDGSADLICFYLPAWLPGPFQWSQAFLPNADVLVSRRDVPQPTSLAALAGEPIGTVHGFSYPTLQAALGPRLLRDDAPSAGLNLRKLAAGRIRHVVLNQLYLGYQLRAGGLAVALHPPLVLEASEAGCALSQRSSVSLEALNRAIGQLTSTGQLEHMLARYR